VGDEVGGAVEVVVEDKEEVEDDEDKDEEGFDVERASSYEGSFV